MRVVFIVRSNLCTVSGGDTIQVRETAEQLRCIGVSVDIKLTNETIDYTLYDLLHFFNIIRPADILVHIKRSGKPFVVSTIYVDYSEYEKNERKGVAGILSKIFSADSIEYFKVIARFFVNGEKINSPGYLFLGQRGSIKKIITKSGMLLPNSNNEYKRLSKDYNIPKEYKVIPNAVDPSLFNGDPGNRSRKENLVICVGRIEGRKNQFNLIKALNDTKFQLVIIGSPSPNQVSYYEKCKKIAAANVSFLENIKQEKLIDHYKDAKVHVLPSWFETTGLSSLEAGAMGCNLVITDKGDTREYFEDFAFYCDPSSTESIFEAVSKAAGTNPDKKLQEKIFSQYTWSNTARLTLQAYNEILQKKTQN